MNAEMQTKIERAMWQPVSAEVRQLHLDTIELELSAPTRPIARRRRVTRRALVIAAAITIATLSGAALAAEGSVPGDLLYPIKQVTEEVRSWFDDDVSAIHRVDELDRVIERDSPPIEIEERLNDARFQVDQLDSDHPLRNQLLELERDLQLQQDNAIEGTRDDPAPPTTERPPTITDQNITDTTVRVDESVPEDPPPTTRPPSDDQPPATEPPPTIPTDEPPATDPPRGDDEPPRDG